MGDRIGAGRRPSRVRGHGHSPGRRPSLQPRPRAGRQRRRDRAHRSARIADPPHAETADRARRRVGALELPTGERFAVEVELTDKAARLALPGGKLDWYRTAGYRGVWWLVPGPHVGRPLERAIAARGYTPDDMWVEPLPPEARAWATE